MKAKQRGLTDEYLPALIIRVRHAITTVVMLSALGRATIKAILHLAPGG
jgi:hypothetical protein